MYILVYKKYIIMLALYHIIKRCIERNVWLKMDKPEDSDYINQNFVYL